MTTKRNLYALAGGCLLAFGASVVNVAFLMRTETSVSHLTGDLSRLAMDLSAYSVGTFSDAARVATAVLGFVLGAVLAGFVIHQPNLELARPYGRTVILIGLLLLASDFLLPDHDRLSIGLAALACGMQNALATRYRQVVLRTTHITGLLTDLGASLGMKLRGRDIPTHAILVPAAMCTAFFAGALTGGYGALQHAAPLLAIVGTGYVLCGVIWSVLKRTILPPPSILD